MEEVEDFVESVRATARVLKNRQGHGLVMAFVCFSVCAARSESPPRQVRLIGLAWSHKHMLCDKLGL